MKKYWWFLIFMVFCGCTLEKDISGTYTGEYQAYLVITNLEGDQYSLKLTGKNGDIIFIGRRINRVCL